jgi:hypothetical protein
LGRGQYPVMERLVTKFERTPRGYSHGMRDIAAIDSELRFLTRVSRAARVFNGQLGEPALTAELIDQLLDERIDFQKWAPTFL